MVADVPKAKAPPRYDIQLEYQEYKDICMDLDEKRKTNPVQFWGQRRAQFPLLSIVARKYLQIPATSVPSERIFLLAGFVVRKKRTKLLPKHVNQQIFL